MTGRVKQLTVPGLFRWLEAAVITSERVKNGAGAINCLVHPCSYERVEDGAGAIIHLLNICSFSASHTCAFIRPGNRNIEHIDDRVLHVGL